MKTNNGQSGGLNAGNALVVQDLHRVTESQPTAWRGATPDGDPVHIAYLFGWLSVEVAVGFASRPGRRSWVTVARFQPALLEEEATGQGAREPVVRRTLTARGVVREIRQSVEADMRAAASRTGGDADVLLDRGRLVIRDRELVRWLDLRNRALAAGGQGGHGGPACGGPAVYVVLASAAGRSRKRA